MKRLSLVFVLLCTIVLYSSVAMAISMDEFKLNGFFDLEYEGSYQDDSSLGDKNGSFDQVHFNLLMEFPLSDDVTVKGHIEYEHSPKIEGGGGTGEINLEWAYFEYIINNNIRIRGGSLLTPFGIYNEIHDATPTYASIRTPWGIYRADKVGGGFVMIPKFITGFNVLGKYYTDGDVNINYVVYIANGENEDPDKNEAEVDENSNKAIGGRLMVSPIPGLTVGGSYFSGKKGETKDDHSTWAGSAQYTIRNIGLRAEYASSKLADTTQNGSYGEVSYRVLRQITPYLRYGMFDPDDEGDDDEWSELVYGINYELQPNFIFKIENRHFNGNTHNAKVSDDYNELGAAVTVAF